MSASTADNRKDVVQEELAARNAEAKDLTAKLEKAQQQWLDSTGEKASRLEQVCKSLESQLRDVNDLRKDLQAKLAASPPAGAGSASGSGTVDPGAVVALQQQVQELQQWKGRVAYSIDWMAAVLKDLFDYSESGITASSVPAFKADLLEDYSKQRMNADGRPLAYCMLTNCYMPSSCVIAAHLWKRLWAKFVEIMGFDEINDPRNGLLLFKPIEWAFDSSRLIFVYDPDYGHLIAYVLDPAIRNIRLVDKLKQLQPTWSSEELDRMDQTLQASHSATTFGELEGRWLRSDGAVKDPKPFPRVLAFQAERAVLKAKEKQWTWQHVPAIKPGTPGPWQGKVSAWFKSIQGHKAADLAAALPQ